MRVVSGTVRGRKLKEPAGSKIRPTTDMVKESLFNIIQFDIEGRRVLDLFAGTGQLGIEALSRGAAHVTFVDEAAAAIELIWHNVRLCGFEKAADVIRGDSMSYLRSQNKYDIIFLDPPYDTGLLDKALRNIFEFDIMRENGIIICESMANSVLPDASLPYYKGKEYKYGKVVITIYGRNSD